MPAQAFNFTKRSIQSLPSPTVGKRDYYKDTNVKGLIIDVKPSGAKSFYLYKKINGKPERLHLGVFPDCSVENARDKANIFKGSIAKGLNPQEDQRKIRNEMSFGELYNQYMERYSKPHKKSWKHDEREIKKFLSHWFTRKISTIKKTDVQEIHEQLFRENGLYQANRLMSRIRAIFNKAIEWGWEGQNPASKIKKYKEQSRDRFIQPDELPKFFKALNSQKDDTLKDYIWMSLVTGARKSNILAMRWEEISFARGEWRIPNTKNGEIITIPLADKAITILKARKSNNSPFVFPHKYDGAKHYAGSKRGWKAILKAAEIENLRIHDIRRTLGSYQAITGASLQVIGKSLGHKSPSATQVYARLTNDAVKVSVENALNAMFVAGKVQ